MEEQNKKDFEKRLYEITRSAQKKAAEINAALTRAEEREEFAKMVEEERARQDAKKRTFANPQSAEEAEAELPTLEQLANGGAILLTDNGKWKTKEEILEDGTLIEKLRLYFASGDLDGYFGTSGQLSRKEIAKIVASIRTKEDKELMSKCYKEYRALVRYGEKMRYAFKCFQASYSMLSVLLNKWDSYEQRAAEYTRLYNSTKNHVGRLTDEAFTAAVLKNVVKDCIKEAIFEGATLYFDEATTSFKVKVDEEGGLYSQIADGAETATEDLRIFKAYAVVIEEFIDKEAILHYLPTAIQMSIENAEEERYTRYLVKNLSYFRSELNRRRNEGENITPEEERRAVVPDFYEVEPLEVMYKSCKKLIKQLI